jgi:hypothetical protein
VEGCYIKVMANIRDVNMGRSSMYNIEKGIYFDIISIPKKFSRPLIPLRTIFSASFHKFPAAYPPSCKMGEWFLPRR